MMETKSVILRTLTPLFIKGKDPSYGEGMLRGKDKQIYLIDNDKLCDYLYNEKKIKEYLAFINALPVGNEFSLSSFLRTNKCEPKDDNILRSIAKSISQLKEIDKKNKFIKDVDGNYYIPGSSIKGAVRNAVLWSLMENAINRTWLNNFVSTNIDNNKIDWKNRSSQKDNFNKDIKYEKVTILEKSGLVRKKKEIPDLDKEYSVRWQQANEQLRDVFKAVKISDSTKIVIDQNYNNWIAPICMTNAGNTNKSLYWKQINGKKVEINLNTIPPGTNISFTISLDTDLLKRMYGDEIPTCFKSIDGLLNSTESFFSTVYHYEREFFKDTEADNNFLRVPFQDSFKTQGFYNQEREKIFRLGWGGGLMTKTQFLLLKDILKKKVRDKYTGHGREINSVYAPKSRCLVISGTEIGKPLGWCELVYEQKKYQVGEIISGTISSFEMVLVQGKRRCRPARVRIERQSADIPVLCDKTSKNEVEAQKNFSKVEITTIDENGIVVGVKALITV